jgi:hypothetical protein
VKNHAAVAAFIRCRVVITTLDTTISTITPHAQNLTKPVDVFPLPIPGTSGFSSMEGCAEENLALIKVCLVLLRAMARVVRTMVAADIMVRGV